MDIKSLNNLLNKNGNTLKIAVLQTDYSTLNHDYKNYDPIRDLSIYLPQAQFENILLNKLTVYSQLKKSTSKNFHIYINLCEGYLHWEVPSIDVIYNLELLNLPYTGPNTLLYDPSKEMMKYIAYISQVKTPKYFIIQENKNSKTLFSNSDLNKLSFPLFIKPAHAGDSLGIDNDSIVVSKEALFLQASKIYNEYAPLLVEEYIDGREFTVLVINNYLDKQNPIVLTPVEYIFAANNSFKTYALKTSELHTDANILSTDDKTNFLIQQAAKDIFINFNGVGYARLDFRFNTKNELFFLEINFTCSVFYEKGYEGSTDYILDLSGYSKTNFLKQIILEGYQRYLNKQKKYYVKGDAISGYGIYANVDIEPFEVVFKGEELAQRIVTKTWVKNNWKSNELKQFAQYAYPISSEVFILWSNNPQDWAPQNHACNSNTQYKGLNVIALHSIKKDTELTLDYAHFLDENMEAFECNCKSENCKKNIKGTLNNNITNRLKIE